MGNTAAADLLTCRRTLPGESEASAPKIPGAQGGGLPTPSKAPRKLAPGRFHEGSSKPPKGDEADEDGGRREPFEVWLLRTGSQWNALGILASPDDEQEHLVIDEVRGPSLIDSWNSSHSEAMKVRPGDKILLVNDVTGARKMLGEIQEQHPGSFLRLVVEPGDVPPAFAGWLFEGLSVLDCSGGAEGTGITQQCAAHSRSLFCRCSQ
mmetsp:Transcript_115033/g.365495  ORF Transcript_115033/g.365495 Transcript_115033/m.365495 type:complete len:208 (+) Transcript_115033:107-730(+)